MLSVTHKPLMLFVTHKPLMLSVVMLNVVKRGSNTERYITLAPGGATVLGQRCQKCFNLSPKFSKNYVLPKKLERSQWMRCFVEACRGSLVPNINTV